jgi:hypothetical protein
MRSIGIGWFLYFRELEFIMQIHSSINGKVKFDYLLYKKIKNKIK